MKHLRTAGVVIGLAAYTAAFYATPLPSVCNDAGQPLRRLDLLWQLLWLPDRWLLPNWFGTPPEFSLWDRLPVLLVAGAILAWAIVLGWLLMFVCPRCGAGVPPAPQLTRLEVFVFSAAVGLSAVSTWVLLLGLFGVMDRLGTFVAPALLTLAVAGYLWRRNGGRVPCPRLPWACGVFLRSQHAHGERGHGAADAFGVNETLSPHWLWLAVPFVLAILWAGMLPPLDFDVREYHLQAPKEFFQQGRITFLPHNVYADMALGTEMLSLLAMIVAGDWWRGALAGKTVIAAFTPLTALALLAAGRRLFSPTAGIVAALVYLSVPWVVSIGSGGLVEGASACYLFLAVYALLLRDKLGTPAFALAGYLAGAAVATKYPAALFVMLPLGAWVLWLSFSRRACPPRVAVPETGRASPPAKRSRASVNHNKGCRWFVRPAAVFVLAAAVGCGLWFGKNWVLSGNPTYPLLSEVFDGRTWTAEKEQQWNRVHRPHDFSVETLGKDIGRVVLTSEWLSPLVVPLAALALFLRWGGHSCLPRGDKNVCPTALVWGLLAYIGFVIAVWWLFTHRIDRFWIPALSVAALLAGAGAAGRRSVGGALCCQYCCWPAWAPTSWWPRWAKATPGSSAWPGSPRPRLDRPLARVFQHAPDRGPVALGRRCGRVRPLGTGALQHVLRRLHF